MSTSNTTPYGTLVHVCGSAVIPQRPATRDEWARSSKGWYDQLARCMVRVDDRPEQDPALLPDPPPEVGTLAGIYGVVVVRSVHGARVGAASRKDWQAWRAQEIMLTGGGRSVSGTMSMIGAPTEDPDPATAEREAREGHLLELAEADRYSRR